MLEVKNRGSCGWIAFRPVVAGKIDGTDIQYEWKVICILQNVFSVFTEGGGSIYLVKFEALLCSASK